MTANRFVQIAIVGGGPAGLAAALHIVRQSPELAREIVVFEAAEHPRPKICGGGVTFHGEEQLRRLGIRLDVPAVPIQNLVFQLGERSFQTPCQNAMRIVQRAEFDAALARAVVDRGVTIQGGEKLLDLNYCDDGVLLITERDRYHARVVVAADGANSTVRRKLALRSRHGVARLLRVVRPVDVATSHIWRNGTALFDFSCVAEGIQGYMWDFPSLINGKPHVNHGIFDSRFDGAGRQVLPHGHLKRVFAAYLRRRDVNLEAVSLQGHPVRWFHPDAEFSRPHVLLTGDAAGVDPLFAEGISYALEYGVIVAEAIRDALVANDFTFRDYRARLLRHSLSRSLLRRSAIARHLYRYQYPWLWDWLWRAAAIAPAAFNQAVGGALDVLPPVRPGWSLAQLPRVNQPLPKEPNREMAVRPGLPSVRHPRGDL